MNERIRELAVKSGIAYQSKQQDHDTNDGFTVIFSKDSLEKFAELIIRQCGYHADVFAALGCPVNMDPTETKPSDYIKKHFGVNDEKV